ncbi:MAG: hypothetical protein HOA61_07815 [Bacteroidetes bacterium]|nr:hypothetical protein [Bacteroidota bacterium]MBT6835937.1 hypothetical protein [Bacteroidota bacterium]MBT7995245.1 hypothetical protein [Bacteroidota bacterium]
MRDVIFQSLNERQKELNCLYGVLELFQNVNESLDFVFRKIVKLIPKGWQFSSVCVVRITFEDQIYCSEDFIETEWFQNANIVVDNNVVGQIEVFYTQFIRELNNSQFLPQEQKLINTIAEKTSNYIFYRKLARTVEYLKEQETIVKNDSPSTEILTASQDEHWNWRLNIAKKIASHIIKDTYDIINLYVIESTNQANAGPASSIDFIIHVKEGSSKIELLKIWFDGWGLCLDEINYQRTGHIANRSLLDLHFVTDKDIEANERYASMINAVDNSEFAIRKLI